MILAQTVHEIYSCEAVGCGIIARFLNFDSNQLEVFSDVISGKANQDVGVDVCVKILGQTVLEICDCLALLRTSTTTPADGPYDNKAKRLRRFC